MDAFVKFDEPSIDEGSCLRRSYGLARTRRSDTDVVIIHYKAREYRSQAWKGSSVHDSTDHSLEERDTSTAEDSSEFLILDDWQSLYRPTSLGNSMINPVFFPDRGLSAVLVMQVAERHLFI